MMIEKLKNRAELLQNKKYAKASSKMQDLIIALDKKEIPDE